MRKKNISIYLTGIGILLIVITSWYGFAFLSPTEIENFNGQRALADVESQVAFGPRTPGSTGHAQALDWMRAELSSAGWETRIQSAEMLGHPIQNVIAYRVNTQPKIIIAAHYDTRLVADKDLDPTKQSQPVPGGNDGASGVAVLLELARVLPQDTLPLWLVFFDAEDNGRITGWVWILGSQAFVAKLSYRPEAVVIVDMIGDADLNIYKERSSNQELTDEIWALAAELGYEQYFIPEHKYSILDDHTPFLNIGISAIDIIDFDYQYWHTTHDTADKVSAKSLEIVGKTLQRWVMERSNQP